MMGFLNFMNGKDPEEELQKFIQRNGVGKEEYEDALEKAKKYAPVVERFLRTGK